MGHCLVLGFSTVYLRAGGSGLNVAIIINQDSTNSIQLGNYYREQRNIPPQNVFRIYWPGSNLNWTLSNYNTVLLNPFTSALTNRLLTNQIDYVVLSMDIPYRIDGDNTGNNENSTTAALFYGFMSDTNPPCDLAAGSSNAYAGSEGIFRKTPPISFASNSWLVTMITETNLQLAEQIIDQGVAGDSTFPTNIVWLGKSDDYARNVRFVSFDNAIFNTRLRGNYSMMRTNTDNGYFSSPVLGYENGTYSFDILPVPFLVPGGFADSLTSYSGEIFENTAGATTMLKFLNDGASGSYGTITEPCDYNQKFPDPQDYFYQSRGFSLAECYYQGLTNPYQGLVVGEPLSAAFAQPGSGSWVGLASNAVLKATTNLSVQFTASDALHPLQQLDLFLDGYWLQTVTNIGPQQSNVLNITINGHSTTYAVPANATVRTVTSNLVNTLNNSAYTNLTKVSGFLHGDRVELQSIAAYTVAGSSVTLSASSTNTSGALTTFVHPSGSNFLDTIAWGTNGYTILGTPASGDTLQLAVTKTNGAMVTVIATNSATNSDLPTFTQQFFNLISSNASLNGSDGLTGESLQPYDSSAVVFDVRALTQGYAAAQIKATLSGSHDLSIYDSGNTTLTDNLGDLRPRAHLYITAGTTNLSLTFPFVTTNLADGFHELDAVAYEGSHVHTQTRATQNIIIQNTSLSATLNTLAGGSNYAVEATLQFSVTPNTNAISLIQLFSTGGLLAAVTNQPTATFSVVATNLGVGLHPFYALVTANSGAQYRTATTWVRLVGPDSPFPLTIGASSPLTLVWPSTDGRSYDVLAYTNLVDPFQVLATVVATNTLAQWVQTNASAPQLFYQIRVSP